MLKRLLLTAFAVFVGYLVQAQTISGTVYKDFNGNGSRQTTAPANEPGVGGIVVNAYDATNTVIETAISASDGTYSMPFTVPVRIEFELPTSGGCVNPDFDFTGFSGDGNNVRFVNAATSGLDYGMLSADEFVVNTDPEIFVPYYIDGDPLGGGSSGTASAFQSHNYSTSGTASPARSLQANQIGAVWGVAFSKQANQVFTSAFIKRHVGLGPMGSGGIYMLTPSGATFTVTQFYDMDANGHRTRAASSAPAFGPGSSFTLNGSPATSATYSGSIDPASNAPEGLGVVGVNGAGGRNLNIDAGFDSNDPAAFDQVGKVGIGDIEISDDGKFLFVMNLYDRKVYRLELNDPKNPTGVLSVTSYSLPTIAVNNGVIRPFALKYHKGKIYVGAVASGEDGGQNIVNGATDLYAYVLELNNASGAASFTSLPILSFPLNYRKGSAIQVNLGASQWYPWNKVTSNVLTFSGEQTLPTPMLSDIEFTDRGDLILDFMDRSGHQYGFQNYQNLSGTVSIFSYDVGGDILVAGYDCATSTYTLESNGSYTSNGTTFSGGVGNNQGPGGGEFFNQEFLPIWHNETSTGSVAVMKGDNKILLTLMDPISDFTGGSAKFSTTDGSKSGALTVFASTTAGTFGKANGLGDIELSGDEPGIEIGNRVWVDIDNDGIQDPGEIGLNDVTVELYADFDNNNIPDGAALGSVTTSSDGNYYFNPTTVIDGDPITPGNQAGPQPNKTYLIQIGSSDWNSGVGVSELLGLSLSPSNVGGAGQPDVRDNDATLMASIPSISVTTGKLGQNDHKADFGFAECVADAGPNVDLNCITTSATIGTPAVVGNTYSWTPATGLSSSTVAQPTASPTTTTTYTLTVNGLCTDVVTVNVDNTPPTADAGSNMDLNCTTTSATIGTAAMVGNTYSWSPSTGLSSTTIAQPTASPSTTTTYTVTVTGANGCSATDVVTVNVDTTPPTADAGSNMDLNCTTTSATIGTAAIVGNTYSWSPSTGLSSTTIAQPTASPSTTTTYTVTVTGANGCSATDVVTVNVDTTPPTADAGSNMDLNCTTTSATIGTAAIVGNTYSWSPSTGLSSTTIAQPTASPSTTTTYTVTVTGANGCSATDVVTVNVDTTPPTADAGSNMDLNCTTTSATIGTAAIVGNAYSWSPSTGLSSTTIAQPTASPSTTTTYTVTVIGANGCSATDVVTVNVDTTPPTADAGSNMDLNCTTTSATIGTAAIVGNTYSWSPSTGLSSTTIAQPTASPSTTTTYTVTVTGANGCSATDVVTVNVDTTPPTADAGSNMDLNCTTTSAMIGTAAIVGNTYSWSPSTGLSSTTIAQPTASPSTTTTYTVTVTGANGCSATDVVTVNVDTTPPTADAGSNMDLNCTTTSATIGTVAIVGNTYSWSPSTGLSSTTIAQPTASPSTTTTYTVTVTGANGCSATDVVTVNVDTTPPSADAGSNMDLNCTTTSATIGTAAIVGNTYSWSPSTGLSSTTIAQPTASPSTTTTYTVTVTGANGCSATDVVTVNVDTTPPTADAGSNMDLNCTTTSATIGTAAIVGNTYSWSPSTGLSLTTIAQPTASPSTTTTYTVTVTGANGCSATDVVTVNVDTTPPTADAGNTLNLDCITNSGIIGTTAIVGNTYSWSPSTGLSSTSIAQPTASPSTTTTYTVTVTGANGCSATDEVTVNVSAGVPTADAGPAQTIDCNTSMVSIGSTAIVGNTYSWDPSSGLSATNIADPTASPAVTTTYTVTVTASSGCTATDVVTVTVDLTAPSLNISGTTTVCNGSTTVLTANGGVSWSWMPGGATSQDITVGAGTYTVTATGTNGCTSSSAITVENKEGSVGNYVWYDMNGNGVADEPVSAGINGVVVELWKESSVGSNTYLLDQTTTTLNDLGGNPGYYHFVICESANYKVKFPLTQGGQGLTDSDVTAATDNNSDANKSSGESPVFAIDVNGTGVSLNNPTIDAGYYKPAQLGNYVWHDVDEDGIQDGNEVGVAGITVTLYNSINNAVVGATVTDAYGYYKFNPLSPGSYYVGFSLPANYVFTGDDAGGDDGLDSDADEASGLTGLYTIVAGDSNMSVDAGIYVPSPVSACLGDRVWMDMNANGIQDGSELGVAGVTVTLYNNAGEPISTTITNSNGIYSFCSLTPGTYSVGFSKPIGYILSPDNQGSDDGADSDADPITGMSSTVTLLPGDNNLSLDAGLYPQAPTTAGLGNYVWNDVNNDGIQGEIETGVAGVTVTLYGADGTTVLSTTTTDELGYYVFNNLTAGSYVVGFSNIPAGFNLTTSDQGSNDALDSDADLLSGKTPVVILAAGEFNMTLDAGIHNPGLPTAALGNYVWFDLNKNGEQDLTENGVPGVSVTLYASDGTTVLDNTVTNTLGYYLFDNLAAGSYVVGFSNIPSGYAFTTADQGNDATDSDVDLVTNKTAVTALANGEVNLTLDGGIIESSGRNNLGSLGDRVWYDDNQNGIQEVGELGTPGVTVTLYAANGTTVLGTKSTDALGNYIFTGLDAGTYVVGFSNIPGGYTFSTADQGVDDELDADADAGSGGKTDPIDLGLGEDNMSVDAGIYPASGLASLGNYVWNDLNLDGVQDANEPGVPGVSVVLYDNSGSPVASTSTDANGLYQFTGLTPAEYSVGFSNLPSGYNFTVVDAGGDDGLDSDADVSSGLTPSVTLIANQNYPDFDAGIFTLLASLGNYVWNDLDNDGIQDALEEGVPGITVTLYASDGITPVSTSVTNAQGYYSFVNLIPDTYVVGFSNIPEGSQFSPSNQGSDDGLDSDVNPLDGKTSSVTLSAGEYNPTLDAGIYTPLGAGLGDYVWYDANDNGQQDASEVGVPGVTAILNDGSGSPLKSTITDANGYYTFPNLAPGVYSVSFTTLPYQRVFSVQNSGSDVSDNDVVNITLLPGGYPAMGTTGNYTLAAGEYNPTIDAGISLSVPLGVSKLQAYAVLEGNVSEVSWITVDEKNVHHFEIERSTDGSSFVQVSQKQALGNTNGQHGYSITDDVLDLMHLNLIYYRVKAVDQDGKFVYSNIVSVRPNQTETISAYPTPFTDQITIDYLSVEASEVDVVLTDAAGKVVAHQLFTTKEGQNRLLFNGLAPLASGQYYIRIVDFYTSEQFILKTMK